MEGTLARLWRDRYARIAFGVMAVAIVLLALSGAFAQDQATGHVRYHAIFAFVLLLIAAAIVLLFPRATVTSRAPIVGLLAFAIAQLIEATGAFGYGPDNDTRRSGIVVLHDVGLGATGVAMLIAVFALAVAVGAFVRARFRGGIVVTGLAGAVFAVAGLLLVRVMVGGF